MTPAPHPLRLQATLAPPLSRGLWLVKWLLAIPHFFLLAFLWAAFFVVSVVAFFAVLFTGSYPRALFDFNVGVLRWTWRVHYYAYGALGTDRYPPFTLADVPDYPAHLDVAYPERLSRGLVLVKWWLLAIPHYVVVGILLGGGTWAFQQGSDWHLQWGGGLIGILVLVVGVGLLFTARYPQPLYDLVVGLDRWVARVVVYAALMTDEYPPFRLDQGGDELVSAPPAPVEAEPEVVPSHTGWTGGRVVSLVLGCIAALVALGLLAGAAVVAWATTTQRDDGYLTSPRVTLSTSSYAVTSTDLDLGAAGGSGWVPASILGTVRIRAHSVDPGTPVFVGVARAADVDDYLSGVQHAVVHDFTDGHATYDTHHGSEPPDPPGTSDIWVAKAAGPGTQQLVWKAKGGTWDIVVMNADGSARVAVRADAGATVPDLRWIGVGLLAGGLVLLVLGAVLIIVPVVGASRRPAVT
jgi:hypothetical protein